MVSELATVVPTACAKCLAGDGRNIGATRSARLVPRPGTLRKVRGARVELAPSNSYTTVEVDTILLVDGLACDCGIVSEMVSHCTALRKCSLERSVNSNCWGMASDTTKVILLVA